MSTQSPISPDKPDVGHALFKGRRVLVTGAGGFIGGHLCRRLLALGAATSGTDRSPAPASFPLTWPQTDLSDAAAVCALFQALRPEIVFHLASRVESSRDPAAVLPQFHDTLAATVHVLCAARESGCERVVLANSAEEPRPGQSDAAPPSPYAAAKFAAGAYGRMFQSLYGLSVVIARFFMVYGPSQQDLHKLIPYVILSLLQNQPPRLTSGQRQVDWIFVEDLLDGLLRLAVAPGIAGETIDLGSGVLHTVREVAEELGRMVNPMVPLNFGAQADRAQEHHHVPADVERTARAIGWRARTSLPAGLEQTVAWYRNQWEIGALRPGLNLA